MCVLMVPWKLVGPVMTMMTASLVPVEVSMTVKTYGILPMVAVRVQTLSPLLVIDGAQT